MTLDKKDRNENVCGDKSITVNPKNSLSSCGCSSSSCGSGISRRRFLQVGGLGILAITFKSDLLMAGPFSQNDVANGYLIPADKKLRKEWIKSLFERGTKEIYRGKALETIGMPCGGIGSGQLYLCGDGTLGDWQLFGHPVSRWIGQTGSTYGRRSPDKPVNQGFAVAFSTGDKKIITKHLSKEGFVDVEFQGEYPIGTVRYSEKGTPIKVEMEAFSPFIPLNAEDSALPATIFSVTIENTSKKSVQASVLGWLQNAVCFNRRQEYNVYGKSRFVDDAAGRMVFHTAETASHDKDRQARPTIIFETFEGDNFGKWKVEGEAFGADPKKANTQDPNEVSGIEGKSFATSARGGDNPQGTLTSPTFKIERHYINFLFGGGGHEQTSIDLIIDGKTVRQTKGWNQEKLVWRGWHVEEFEGKDASIVIRDAVSAGWGHVHADTIEFSDQPRSDGFGGIADLPDYGNMTLMCLDAGQNTKNLYPEGNSDTFITDGETVYPMFEKKLGLLRSKEVEIAPGKKQTYRFIMSWYFPNMDDKGRMYAAKFADSGDVARYIVKNYPRLTADTRLWRDMYYDSTLPYWLLDRLHSTASYLSTGTARWWKDGRFYAFEGVTCCHGTCTHVWGYAHGHARLFPEIGRNIRERQDFAPIDEGGGFYPDTGLISFRADKNFGFAADGQCEAVLNAYREHLMSADNSFLKRNYVNIKKTLEYLIEQDAKGEKGGSASPASALGGAASAQDEKIAGTPNGLIEGTQHNTYDLNYYGPNTFVGSLYLAALRAGEEMAKEMGDADFAKQTRQIFESGQKLTMEKLWDGEYFIQEVDLKKYPQHQYGHGCLSDQVFGQGWAHQVGLGYIYPKENVQSALKSVWKYNWAPDIGPYNKKYKPGRWFITPGQAGLLTCTWPKSEYLTEGTLYREEVWTGIEYQVAGDMIWEGFLTEGLAMCRAVHDRYSPELMNPYNEIECGDHYARAMASWGVYLALAGFDYNGPKGSIAFAPRITPENFRAAFTFAEGWATFDQKRKGGKQYEKIEVKWGTLRIKTLSFTLEKPMKTGKVSVRIDEKDIKADTQFDGNRVTIILPNEIVLSKNSQLNIVISK